VFCLRTLAVQVSTLKQIRSAYDELSSGYRKLLTASELYNRDTAPPQQRLKEPAAEPVPLQEPPKHHSPPARKLAPKSGVLSEQDDTGLLSDAHSGPAAEAAAVTSPGTGQVLVPMRPQGSAGGSRASSARQLAVNLVQSLNIADTDDT
jgi:hypothetical protein